MARIIPRDSPLLGPENLILATLCKTVTVDSITVGNIHCQIYLKNLEFPRKNVLRK